MSDIESCEDLSEEVVEELRVKGLYSFVAFNQSSNNSITLSVYDNEKYRPIVREWGSAVGIHLFPPLDRKPLTDDMGKHSISGPLSDIQPIKGYKWLGNWTVVIEAGVTDDQGYQYAGGWSKLNSKHTLSDHAGRLRFVRRRQWTRVMVVDPDPPSKRLPYELEIRLLGTTQRSGSSSSSVEAYLDTYINDVLHSTTFLAAAKATGSGPANVSAAVNTCTTTVVLPMLYLDADMRISFVVHKNRPNKASQSSSGRVDLKLSHILKDKGQGFINHEYPLQGTSNRFLQLSIELREQLLFAVAKHRKQRSKGSDVVISARMKEKIVVLSLAINSDCNGLLDEIVWFLSEADEYITELDLFDIIDDITQMYKNSEYSKLITLLQDHPLKSVTPYPLTNSEWCVYAKVISLPPPAEQSSSSNASNGIAAMAQRRGSLRGSALSASYAFQQRYEEVEQSNHEFLRYQPVMCRDRTPGFQRGVADTPVEVANITPGLRGYRLTICCSEGAFYELIWGNFFEYIEVQKVFSILKYQPDVVESGQLDGSWSVLYYPVEDGVVAKESVKATLHLNAQNMCFQIGAPRAERGGDGEGGGGGASRPTSMRVQFFEPVTISFDEIEYIEVGCSHHIPAMYVLDVKLLSLQALLLRYMMQNKTYIELNTADGQHVRVDLNGSKTDTYRLSSTSSFAINETVRVLVPAEVMEGPHADEFLYMTIQTDGTWDEGNATDITQRVAALANDDAFFPTPLAGSFKPERSRSMFSTKKAASFNAKADIEPAMQREPSNRMVIKLCNRVPIPLTGLLDGNERESQVNLYKLNCRWRLMLFKVDGQVPRRSTEPSHAYFYVYLADANGDVIQYHAPEKERDRDVGASPQRSPKKDKSRSSLAGGGAFPDKTGHIHRSSVTASSAFMSWGEMDAVEISTEKHGDVINSAKYVMVQFWGQYPSGANPDFPIGEILIPLLSAHKLGADEFMAGSVGCAEKHRVLLPSSLNTRKTSQAVNTGLVASAMLTMCPVTDADYDASDRATIKLKTSLKPLQSADCSWPCRFLQQELGGVQAEAFHFFPAHDGLYILGQQVDTSGELQRHPKSVGTVLSECLERKTYIGQESRLQLVIPYSQVSAQDMHIITDNMMVLKVNLKRSIKVHGSSHGSKTADVKFEILVGPCLAKDLYTIMHNRISLHYIRATLSMYATDKRKEEAAVFEDVARLLQEEILTTMQGIDQYAQIKPAGGSSDNDHHQHHDPQQDLSHLFPLKLLYLKKAALKIYLWFLIEQTKLQFGGKAYVESTQLLFNDIGGEASELYEDTDALMQRIGQTMDHLDQEVRSLVFQAHKQAKHDISPQLTPIVYDRYLMVIQYLARSLSLERKTTGSGGVGGTGDKIYTTADPQKKRNLIKYVITHDNMFEVCLNSTLRPHDYQFSISPLLSICIDFEQLIERFAALVNENILLWNERTFEHFRTHKEKSNVLTNQDFAPWAVTTMVESSTNHELYISNIPETIQTQLNVEIGLKKVPILGSNLGAQSLSRVYLLNQKISAAIAKVYLALASEYEKVLISGLQNKVLRDANNRSKNAMAVSEDDMICFLVSLVNDCHRMYTKHIPDSMSSFLEEEVEEGEGGSGARGTTASILESMQKEGVASVMDQSTMLFLVSSKAMEAVAQNAINLLSNQIFFFSELRVYFLLAFDAHVVTTQSTGWRKRRSGVGEAMKMEAHSPIEVISATLTDFFQFTSQHLNEDDVEKLLYVCIKKVVIRYLVFLRDLLVTLPAPGKSATSSSGGKKGDGKTGRESEAPVLHQGTLAQDTSMRDSETSSSGNTIGEDDEGDSPARGRSHDPDEQDSNVPYIKYDENEVVMGPGTIYEDTPLQKEQILQIRRDVKTIVRLHSILKLKIDKAGGSSGAAENDRSFNETGSEADKEESDYHTYYNNSAANLFSIILDVSNRLMMGEIKETKYVDQVIYNHFSITPPPWTTDRAAYEKALTSFLELNSNFIQQHEDGDASVQTAQNYTIQITNLSCVKQFRYPNSFVRVIFDNQVQETAVRSVSKVHHSTTWDGTITFKNVQNYENKIVELQIVGYRLRALQHYRERLIGSVKINLSVLAQSSPYIADVAPAPSSNRKSFAARLSMSETFSKEALQESGVGGADSIILANHCAWFVVDKKRRGGEPQVAENKVSKANSVVRLLSSETVRMDIEDTQLRVGIKMIKHNALRGTK